ncbi:hypothetical protein F4678DRAFT_409039 [Xylaria arbuscula]|nr:hypothetical protein F4678DRAFT_409039 [Xylaria arbuscula]
MDSARKIELQAAEDLAYLVANVRRAAAARIDEAFPPVDDSTEDELRTQIEAHVNEYILKTFSLAAPNLTINGLPVDAAQFLSSSSAAAAPSLTPAEPEEVFEPFDARKRARVEALAAEEEDLLRDIAHLKKSVPGSVAGVWAEAARKGTREDEAALETANALATTTRFDKSAANPDVNGERTATAPTLAISPLERQDGVEAGFGDAVRGLGRLKKEMPAVVARMERARKAGEYVVTER